MNAPGAYTGAIVNYINIPKGTNPNYAHIFNKKKFYRRMRL